MPAVAAWLVGLGFYKLAGLVTAMAAAGIAFYKFSFEICLMGSLVSLFFSMFGFKLARGGVLLSVALYVVTQVFGAAIR